MNPMLKKLLARYMAPAGDDGVDTGGTDTAVADAALLDDDAYMALSAEERSRLRGDGPAGDASTQARPAEAANAPDDAPAGAASDPEEAGDKGGTGIPRARFNEVNDRRKALEAENEELRAQLSARGTTAAPGPAAQQSGQPETQALNVLEAEEQYAQLMLEGETKAAAALRLKINASIEEAAFARFNQANASERAHAQAAATVEQLLGQYPWLDEPEGAPALELIEASVLLKMGKGMPRHQALSEAVQTIAPRFAPGNPPYRAGREEGGSGDMRVERANKRGAADSMLQPATLQAGMGNRTTPTQVDASKLSDDEYMNLPEAERKRLRGD